ncbi:hypothetical protein OAS21_01985 [Pelagibacteraceae bacterium]|nr:hypothetical protein [Pelagibacteraceae bacterium]
MKKKKKKTKKKHFKKKSKNSAVKKKNNKIIKKRKKTKESKSKKKNKSPKRRKTRAKKIKVRKVSKSGSSTRVLVQKFLKINDKLKNIFRFNFNLDQSLQNFFQGISNKVSNIKKVIQEEKEKQKQLKVHKMEREKIEIQNRLKSEKENAFKAKAQELKDEIKLEKERKKELQKFVRLEQAEVRKEQAEKQRKFLEQIKLEKKIEQFRKREALEIKNLEKFVLGQERESYTSVQERIDKIKEKYQRLRDQKIADRVKALGIEVQEGDDRSALLEKERVYNLERKKIEFALESFYRSAHSLCFQINKRYIPKYLSIMRVIDRRFETGEIFIKWDDAPDEEWLILIYIKNNSPDEGIVIEDKTNPEKNSSYEYQSNEIFKASDMMVDALTKLLDSERNKRKANQ